MYKNVKTSEYKLKCILTVHFTVHITQQVPLKLVLKKIDLLVFPYVVFTNYFIAHEFCAAGHVMRDSASAGLPSEGM